MSPFRITLLVAAVVGATVAPAKADKPRSAAERRSDRQRALHAVAIGGFAAVYVVSEVAVKDTLAPDECGWCDPPGFDRSVRDALVWDDTARAGMLSNLTGYAAPPVATIGLLLASTWCERDGRRWFDDVAPVLEAALSVSLVTQLAKFMFGRARPLVRFAAPGREPELDDNTSFFSGHTSLAFAQAVAAGVVAHRRGYELEPVIWGAGLSLAAATGYLRIAADKHYLSDVVVGAAMGTAFGLLVPRIFHADVLGDDVALVPIGNGVAITGTF